ncbi:MAG: ABC transporter ATP-binding protein [Hyphomicrobiales bacterium]
MYHALRIFFGKRSRHPVILLLCLILASISESLGISSILPILANISGEQGGKQNAITAVLNQVLAGLGLEPSVGAFVSVFLILFLIKGLLSYGALSYAGISAAKLSIDLRQALLTAIFGARWSYFVEGQIGRLSNAMANDAARAGDAYLFSAQSIGLAIQALGYVIVAIFVDWRLALFGMAGAALLIAITQSLLRITRRMGDRYTQSTSDLSSVLVNTLGNVKPIKTMARQSAMIAVLSGLTQRIMRSLSKRELSRAGLNQGGDFLLAAFVGISIYAAYRFLHMSLSELVVGAVVAVQIISISAKLQKNLQVSIQNESAFFSVESMIADAEAMKESNTGHAQPRFDALLRFANVSFSHGSHQVLEHVSCEIQPGQITVLSGPSGSGKTTLTDLLTGLQRPNAGAVMIGDTALQDIDMNAWRSRIGYVPQELNLFRMSVRDNITLRDAAITDTQLAEALRQAGALDFVAGLPNGLDTDVGEMGNKLSGGQRQRISLARALVGNPRILVLDEVTSALDPASEAEIIANIAALRGAYTIIAITHRPAWLEIADRVLHVSEGRVRSEVRSPNRR